MNAKFKEGDLVTAPYSRRPKHVLMVMKLEVDGDEETENMYRLHVMKKNGWRDGRFLPRYFCECDLQPANNE